MAVVRGTAARNILKGTNAPDRIFGLAGNDTLTGLNGNDTLDGGAGIDVMRGGRGNDTYVVDNVRDRAIEGVNQGNDLVRASVSFTLGNNVERLLLTTNKAINGTGNGLANTITGNGAANTLSGGGGNDTLNGGGGNDTLRGGLGNDTISGGTGTDVAVFAGVRADYTITLESGGIRVVGPDGSDLVNTDVETLRFDDEDVATNTFGPSGPDIANLDPSEGFIIRGGAAQDRLGVSAAAIGDVNGDGFADFAVGANLADGSTSTDDGEVYVIFGTDQSFGSPDGAGRSIVDAGSLDAATGFVIQGSGDERAGFSVSSAGDINGDGFEDILIGANENDEGGARSGATYVVYGTAGGFGTPDVNGRQVVDLATLAPVEGFVVIGAAGDTYAGTSVASIGDLNGDGFGDIVIGALSGEGGADTAGKAYVIFGTGSGFGTLQGGRQVIELATLGTDVGFVIDGETLTSPGYFHGGAGGDVNGDGIDDFIIGTYSTDEGQPNAFSGIAYVVFGSTTPFGAIDGSGRRVLEADDLTTAQGFSIKGEDSSDFLGLSVDIIGDIDGDGFADVLVGASGVDDGGDRSGAAYVVFGKSASFGVSNGNGGSVIAVETLAAADGFVIQGEGAQDAVGFTVGAAGDVNGDGFADLIVGAYYARNADGVESGAGYVIFGSDAGFGSIDGIGRRVLDLSTLSDATGFKIAGDDFYDFAGISVSGAGDINGDGFDDVLVGASLDSTDFYFGGETYVIFGGLFGGSATPATFTGNGTGENIVGGAGNDTLSGGGGADVIRGGAGDDLITIGDATFFRIDAGNGQDTLLVAGFDLDLTAISNLALKDMETINMAGVGNNTLTLSISDLLDLDGSPNAALAASGFVGDLSHNSLVVMGLAGDAVDLAASGAGDVGEGGAWTLAGSTTIGANTYDVYNFLDGAALLGTIAVDDDMSVTIV